LGDGAGGQRPPDEACRLSAESLPDDGLFGLQCRPGPKRATIPAGLRKAVDPRRAGPTPRPDKFPLAGSFEKPIVASRADGWGSFLAEQICRAPEPIQGNRLQTHNTVRR